MDQELLGIHIEISVSLYRQGDESYYESRTLEVNATHNDLSMMPIGDMACQLLHNTRQDLPRDIGGDEQLRIRVSFLAGKKYFVGDVRADKTIDASLSHVLYLHMDWGSALNRAAMETLTELWQQLEDEKETDDD